MNGTVELRKNFSKHKKDKALVFDEIVFFILQLIAIIAPLIGTYFIFKSCIDDAKLANTISLGSIFATFGSAIIANIVLIQTDKLNRILVDVNILYTEILKREKWTRWPFIKRSSTSKLLDGSSTSSELKNPTLPFNVGSHTIEISIPTAQEDFFDLPTLLNFFKMARYDKQFKTCIVNKKEMPNEFKGLDVGDYYLSWDCLYDIWKNVLLFKINKLLIKFATSILVSGIIYSFYFQAINNLVMVIIKRFGWI